MLRYTLILFFFVSLNSFSQKIQVEYFENKIVKKPEEIKQLPANIQKDFEPNRFGYTLTYIDGISMYENKDFSVLLNTNTEPTTEIVDLGNGEKMTFVGTFNDTAERYRLFEKKFFKDYLSKKIYAELFTNEKKQIVDNFFNWQWEITNEQKEISGYMCTKAISKINGYHFEAWFTEEIPISAGPEKYDSLPGLILYVNTGAVELVAKSVKFIGSPINIQKPTFTGQTYTFNEVYMKPNAIKPQFKSVIEKDPNNSNIIKQTITY